MTQPTKPDAQVIREATEKILWATQETTPGGALRANVGKLAWSLLPLQFLEGVVRVLMHGAVKYKLHNWRKGMPWSEAYNSAQRHLVKFQRGEDIDLVGDDGLPGTMEHHIDCAITNLIFLRAYIIENPELDDRYKAPPKD